MNGTLSGIVIALSLLLGLWSLVAGIRDRAPDRGQLLGLVVVELGIIVLLVASIVTAAGGDRPASLATFLGYAATIVWLPPLGWLLARLEPTRWGSVIVFVIGVTIPVLVVRLHQTWEVVTSG